RSCRACYGNGSHVPSGAGADVGERVGTRRKKYSVPSGSFCNVGGCALETVGPHQHQLRIISGQQMPLCRRGNADTVARNTLSTAAPSAAHGSLSCFALLAAPTSDEGRFAVTSERPARWLMPSRPC